MHTLEATTAPVLNRETPEATLARLVAVANQFAPDESSRLMVPRFIDDGRSPHYGSLAGRASAPRHTPDTPIAALPTFDWWGAGHVAATGRAAVLAPPTEQPRERPTDELVEMQRVPIIPGRKAVGVAAVHGATAQPEAAHPADAHRPARRAEAAADRSGLSPRLKEHLTDVGDSYKGMRRNGNKESFGRRLARVGRRLGFLALGAAAAFASADTLVNHVSN